LKKNTTENSDRHNTEGDDSKPPGRTNERSSMLKLESLDQIKRRDLMRRQKEMLQ